MSEVIFALTKRSRRFWVRLNARSGEGQGKISRRSWLLDIVSSRMVTFRLNWSIHDYPYQRLLTFHLGLNMITFI